MTKKHHKQGRGSRPVTPAADESRNPAISSDLASLVALATVPFLLSIGGEFVFDDRKTVVENPIVRGIRPLSEILSSDYWGDPLASKTSHKSYRPLTTITFWLNHHLHGLWTPGYHAINILLHAINTLLVYRLATVTSRKLIGAGSRSYGSWAAAAAFAVHPVHVEAIANVSGRAELLSALSYLSSILLYLGRQSIGSVPRSVIYTVLVVSSVASKEQGITSPIICLALEWILYRRVSIARTVGNILLVGSVSIARLWLNAWSAPRFGPQDNPAAFLHTPFWRAINYAQYWMYSLSLLVLPTSLCFDYSMGCFPPILSLVDYRILSTVALIGLAFAILGALYGADDITKRWMLSIGALTVLPFLPASNLLVTVGFTVAERVLYLPSIGFCLLIPFLLDFATDRMSPNFEKSMKNAGWTLLLIGVALSAQRSLEWRSSLSLFSKDLGVCPNNAKIHYNLGKVLADQGSKREAEVRYREALRLHPAYESALNNLGNLLEASGRTADAEEYLLEAIRVAPTFATAWMNLGIAQMRAGKYNMSSSSLLHSLRLRPSSAEANFNLGVLRLKMGEQAGAREAWMRAVSLDPAHTRAWSNLFLLLDEMGRCEEMIDLSLTATKSNPSSASIHLSIGTCYAKLDNFPSAEFHLHRAVEISPSTAIYHANLGVLYQRWHRFEQARQAYSMALRLDPTIASIRENLEVTDRKINQTRRNFRKV